MSRRNWYDDCFVLNVTHAPPAYGLSAHFPADLPVLFIYGTADPTVVQSVVENSKKFIPRYQLVAVEGKGHWLMVDSKDVITNRVAEWLECLRAGRSKL